MRANTIGEVLNRLRDEFDEITISKIRLIEAEGLITPDRTESGYRKFTESDIERLRYILRAQRDRGEALAVIRQELALLDAGHDPAVPETDDEDDEPEELRLPLDQARFDQTLDVDLPNVQLSRSELADAAGLSIALVDALCDHGILPRTERFDGDGLRIARICAQMITGGLEPRHLRMYRQFAQRESALISQLVSPLLRQRNPDSRQAAVASSEMLAELGAELKQAMLVEELRRILKS